MPKAEGRSENEVNLKDRLDSVSPSFCLAKWLQVTVDLKRGMTHSCHHPGKHVVPLSELKNNPGALHNTVYKKDQRRKMLSGERPLECSYCWEAEDAGVTYSDRLIKSTDSWAWPDLERIEKLPWDADVNPRFLEVMLDDTCNFSCMYCIADSSTSIAAEMREYGDYAVHIDNSARRSRRPRIQGDNPYEAAFWQWLPEILPDLRVLRLTGGEPLLSPSFAKILEFLRQDQNPGLTVGVNSHFGHSPQRMQTFLQAMNELVRAGKIGAVELYTSVDTWGGAAEYIRHGLDYSRWLENLRLAAAQLPEAPIVVMCTFNILSIAGFRGLLDDVVTLKRNWPGVVLDISSLRKPGYLRADMIDETRRSELIRLLEYMKSFGQPGFSDHEIAKMDSVVRWACRPINEGQTRRTNRADFFRFIKEYDRRKSTEFLATFPDWMDFMLLCKQEAVAQVSAVASQPTQQINLQL